MITGKPNGKRTIERHRHRWEGNIIMDLKEIGLKTRILDGSAKDRDFWRTLGNVALNLRASLAMK